MSLIRSTFSIGSMTLLSRLFGFVRDMLVAHMLGAGMLADAFVVAFKLPNFFRRLFAEGAFNQAFLPMFAGMLKTEGREPAMRFASDALSWLLMVVSIVSALCMVFMPAVMFILAYGFEDDAEKYALAVQLTRITFPYLICITLVSLLGSILNSTERFTAVAATPIIMNISMIVGVPLFLPYVPNAAYAFAWGVFLAGVTQLVWLLYFCRKANALPRLHLPRLSPEVRRLLLLLLPAAFGAGVTQINLMVDTLIASLIDGGVSFLYYADRIFELPLGVIGIAVATALLPLLSKQIRSGDRDGAIATTNQSIKLVMMLGLPACGAFLVIAQPIIQVVFERGAFSRADTLAVYPALMAFAIGLPGHLVAKILASNFFAAQDTKTPVKIAMVCVALNVILNFILMQFLAHVGLALSTSICGYVNAGLLAAILLRRGQFVLSAPLKHFLLQCLTSTLVMMAALSLADLYFMPWFEQSFLVSVIALSALVALGAAAYGSMLLASGAIRLNANTIKRE